MSQTGRTIHIDAGTAAIVDRRSAELGVSAPKFVAALVANDDAAEPVGAAEIAELDRRWAAIQQGQPTIDHADVCRWLNTWGTADFKPWSGQR